MTTRLVSARTRAASRSIVVLPSPGAEQQHALAAVDQVLNDVDRAVHRASDAAGEADEPPRRLRMAEMRCSVRSMPARLSASNSPMRATT